VQYTKGALRTGGVITVGFVIVTAVGTGLVPNSAFDRYVPRSGLDVLFLSSTALLLGTYTTQQCTRVDCSHSPVAYLGGIGGYLSVACPHCLPVVAGTFSASAIAVHLVPLRPLVGIGSLGLLIGVIVVRQRRLVTEGPAVSDVSLACPTCGTILKKAADEPDPDFVDGRMRLELPCPNCADPLLVSIDVVSGERVDVRKRVERKAETKTDRMADRSDG